MFSAISPSFFMKRHTRAIRNRASEWGGESLVTTELLGVHALIVFIMVMTTVYAHVLIIHTVTSHEHCVQDSVVVFYLWIQKRNQKQILFPNPAGSHTKTSLQENKEV